MEELNSLLKVKLHNWYSTLKLLEWILLVNDIQLSCISCLKFSEHESHQISDEIQYLKVMVLKFHLHIKSSELTKMSISVRILSTEDWTNLEHSLQVTTEGHLLVKLWTLSKACIPFEVFKFKDICTTFRGSCNQFWSVDLNKVIIEHEFTIELAYT